MCVPIELTVFSSEFAYTIRILLPWNQFGNGQEGRWISFWKISRLSIQYIFQPQTPMMLNPLVMNSKCELTFYPCIWKKQLMFLCYLAFFFSKSNFSFKMQLYLRIFAQIFTKYFISYFQNSIYMVNFSSVPSNTFWDLVKQQNTMLTRYHLRFFSKIIAIFI